MSLPDTCRGRDAQDSLARNVYPFVDVSDDLGIIIVHARGGTTLPAVPVPPAQGTSSEVFTVVAMRSLARSRVGLGTGVGRRRNGVSRRIDSRLEGQGLVRVDQVDG